MVGGPCGLQDCPVSSLCGSRLSIPGLTLSASLRSCLLHPDALELYPSGWLVGCKLPALPHFLLHLASQWLEVVLPSPLGWGWGSLTEFSVVGGTGSACFPGESWVALPGSPLGSPSWVLSSLASLGEGAGSHELLLSPAPLQCCLESPQWLCPPCSRSLKLQEAVRAEAPGMCMGSGAGWVCVWLCEQDGPSFHVSSFSSTPSC